MRILATTSLPAVDRPNAGRWNGAHSCQQVGTDLTQDGWEQTNTKPVKDLIRLGPFLTKGH